MTHAVRPPRPRRGAPIALLAGVTVIVAAAAGAQTSRRAPGFDPAAIVTLRGTVKAPAGEPVAAGRIRLHTAEGDIPVRLGPPWFLRHQGLELRGGDEIEVRGVRSKGGGAGFVVATQVRKGGQVVHLRDETTGRSLWRAARRRMRSQRRSARRTAAAARRTPPPAAATSAPTGE